MGVVFVADSNHKRVQANIKSWQNMKSHLISLNIPPHDIPTVVQFNKQDIPGAVPIPYLKKSLRLNGQPSFSAVAINGKGVFETLKTIINYVVKKVQREVA